MVNFNVIFGPAWSILMSFPGSPRPTVNSNVVFGPAVNFSVIFKAKWSILMSFSARLVQFGQF